MASVAVKKLERREVLRQVAIEKTIDPEVLAEFAAFANFRPHVYVECGTSREVGFWRVQQAEQGGKACPFGIPNCEFDTCTPDSEHCAEVTIRES